MIQFLLRLQRRPGAQSEVITLGHGVQKAGRDRDVTRDSQRILRKKICLRGSVPHQR